jgi:hypothetical protein
MMAPPSLSPEEADLLRRRRRGRNLMVLGVLLALSALFYAITVVKIGQGTLRF